MDNNIVVYDKTAKYWDVWLELVDQGRVWVPQSEWKNIVSITEDLSIVYGMVPVKLMDLSWKVNVIRFLWGSSVELCKRQAKDATREDFYFEQKAWEGRASDERIRKNWFSTLPLVVALSSGNKPLVSVKYSKLKKDVPLIGCISNGCEEYPQAVRTVAKGAFETELDSGYCLGHSTDKMLEDISNGYKIKYQIGENHNVWIKYEYNTSGVCEVSSCANPAKFNKKWGQEVDMMVCGEHFEYFVKESGLESIAIKSQGNNLDIILNTNKRVK